MSLSTQYNIIFLHNPKAAGTAICAALSMGAGHMTLRDAQAKYLDCWKEYFKFSIVRDPFDRAVSCYEYALMQSSHWHDNNPGVPVGRHHPDHDLLCGKSFEECLAMLIADSSQFRHHGWKRQIDFIQQPAELDLVARFETIATDWPRILKQAGINDSIDLAPVNVTTRLQERAAYRTPAACRMVARFYARDYRLFAYDPPV
jgi:hypothetical protein